MCPSFGFLRGPLLFVLLTASGCSSVPSRVLPDEGRVRQLQIRGVHLRPAGASGIQGCVPLRQWPTPALRASLEECFQKIPEGTSLHVRLAREEKPYWVLDQADYEDEQERRRDAKLDELPLCLRSALERWEAPLEIVFVSTDPNREWRGACYSQRLEIGTDRFFGVDWQRMRGKFAWSTSSDRGVHGSSPSVRTGGFPEWLDAWMLSPFFDPEKAEFTGAVLLPDRLCQQCLGEKAFADAMDPQRADESLWPNASSRPTSPGASPGK